MDSSSEFEKLYADAMAEVAKALKLDESSNTDGAITTYLNAMQYLEKGFLQAQGLVMKELNTGTDKYLDMQMKIERTLEHVRSRVYILSEQQNIKPDSLTELFEIPGGVQLFCVNQTVSSSANTSAMQIFISSDVPKPSWCIIQVGAWTHPLYHGCSPVFLCSNGAYMFPKLGGDSEIQEEVVGIVLSSDLDTAYHDTFQGILDHFAVLKQQDEGEKLQNEQVPDLSVTVPFTAPTERKTTWGDSIASGIGIGAAWASWGLSKGSEGAMKLISKGNSELKKNLSKNENPTKVDPKLQKGLYYTEKAAKSTAQASGVILQGMYSAASKLATYSTPHVKAFADKHLPSSATKKDKDGVSKVGEAVKVGYAGVAAFANVWTSMETAGLAIAKSISSATVDTVNHKYGEEAAVTTGHALNSGINIGKTALNVNNMGIKVMAKKVAKDTGKQVLKEYSDKHKNNGESSYQKNE